MNEVSLGFEDVCMYVCTFLLLACANASTGVRTFVCTYVCECVRFRDTNCASKVVRD